MSDTKPHDEGVSEPSDAWYRRRAQALRGELPDLISETGGAVMLASTGDWNGNTTKDD